MRNLLLIAFVWALSTGICLAHFRHSPAFAKQTESEIANNVKSAIILGPILATIIIGAGIYDMFFTSSQDGEKDSK